ncbi:MAG: PilZ domain-containing protein [Sphingomonadales bacterium]|nr:PilZ domain-containing protein [Sphingomonadales bacterium]MDE2568230.1 PilZ domain-containing protein [Sphingomonadales bacterium]
MSVQDDPDDPLMPGRPDGRRDPRRELAAEAVIKNARQLRIGGSLVDISEHGCRIEIHVGTAERDQIVTIRLGNMDSWAGVVRWSNGSQVGIEFMTPLHSAVVDHLSQTYAAVEIV